MRSAFGRREKTSFDDLPYIEVFADRMADLTKLIGIIKETFPDAA